MSTTEIIMRPLMPGNAGLESIGSVTANFARQNAEEDVVAEFSRFKNESARSSLSDSILSMYGQVAYDEHVAWGRETAERAQREDEERRAFKSTSTAPSSQILSPASKRLEDSFQAGQRFFPRWSLTPTDNPRQLGRRRVNYPRSDGKAQTMAWRRRTLRLTLISGQHQVISTSHNTYNDPTRRGWIRSVGEGGST
ncbi:hypothetical protein XANCAGTX0491_001771 [Xanthoria calcicola]